MNSELAIEIDRISRDCIPRFADATVGFMHKSGEQRAHLGTGVLLQIGDIVFVFTAAHVTDDFDKCPTFLNAGVPMAKPCGKEMRILKVKGPYDIAVCELPPEMADHCWKHRTILNTTDIDCQDDQHQQNLYWILGFPMAGLDNEHSSLTGLSYPSNVYLYERGPITEYDFTLDCSHILLNFNPDGNRDPDGDPAELPPPKGMSGCGIFRVAKAGTPREDWKPAHAKLVAIEHTRLKSVGVMVGTNIAVAMRLIWEKYEHLQPGLKTFRANAP